LLLQIVRSDVLLMFMWKYWKLPHFLLINYLNVV